MSERTPGEWVVGGATRTTVFDAHGEPVAGMFIGQRGDDGLLEIQANARFIVAGPDMEDSLLLVDSEYNANGYLTQSVLQVIRTALAKARGEPVPPPTPARTYADLSPGELNDIDP